MTQRTAALRKDTASEHLAADMMAAQSVLVTLETGMFGNRRKGNIDEIQTGADKAALSLWKKLIMSDALKAIERFDTATESYLRDPKLGVGLPSFFREGIYWINVAIMVDVDEYLEARKVERDALVDTFIAEYPRLVHKARRRLGPQFRDRDYPDVDDVRAAFTFDWQFIEATTPKKLQTIHAGVYARQAARLAGRMESAAEQARQLLRATAFEMARHMADRLEPGTDGRRKVFRDTMIEKMQTFLNNFDLRNVTNDRELGAVVRQMRGLLGGVTSDALRDDAALRQDVGRQVDRFASMLDSMVEKKGRRIVVDDPANA